MTSWRRIKSTLKSTSIRIWSSIEFVKVSSCKSSSRYKKNSSWFVSVVDWAKLVLRFLKNYELFETSLSFRELASSDEFVLIRLSREDRVLDFSNSWLFEIMKSSILNVKCRSRCSSTRKELKDRKDAFSRYSLLFACLIIINERSYAIFVRIDRIFNVNHALS